MPLRPCHSRGWSWWRWRWYLPRSRRPPEPRSSAAGARVARAAGPGPLSLCRWMGAPPPGPLRRLAARRSRAAAGPAWCTPGRQAADPGAELQRWEGRTKGATREGLSRRKERIGGDGGGDTEVFTKGGLTFRMRDLQGIGGGSVGASQGRQSERVSASPRGWARAR